MSHGFITLLRSIRESFIWNDKPYSFFQAWTDLVMDANYHQATNNVLFHGRVEYCYRGQLITSFLKLASRWGWERKRVKRFLDLCSQEEIINYQIVDKRFIIVTICNYEQYQGGNIENGQETANRWATDGQQMGNRRPTTASNSLIGAGFEAAKNIKNKNNNNINNIYINSRDTEGKAEGTAERKNDRQKTNPQVELFLDYARESFRKIFGDPLKIDDGKDKVIINKLFDNGFSLERLEELWQKFLELDDSWIKKVGRGIRVFSSKINQLTSAGIAGTIKRSVPETQTRSRDTDFDPELVCKYRWFVEEELNKAIKNMTLTERGMREAMLKRTLFDISPYARNWDEETVRETIEENLKVEMRREVEGKVMGFKEWRIKNG